MNFVVFHLLAHPLGGFWHNQIFFCLPAVYLSPTCKANQICKTPQTDLTCLSANVSRLGFCFVFLLCEFLNRKQRRSTSPAPGVYGEFSKSLPMLKFAVNGKLYTSTLFCGFLSFIVVDQSLSVQRGTLSQENI